MTRIWPRQNVYRYFYWLVLSGFALLLGAGPATTRNATSAPTTAATTAPTTKPTTKPTTAPVLAPPLASSDDSDLKIKLPDVASEGESVTIQLSGIDSNISNDSTTDRIRGGLTALKSEIEARTDEAQRVVAASPSLQMLRSLEQDWQFYSDQLDSWKKELVARRDQLRGIDAKLFGQEQDWLATLKYALGKPQNANLEALEQGIKKTLMAMEAERRHLKGDLTEVYSLEREADEQKAVVVEVLASVKQARESAFDHLLMRDASPAWAELAHVNQLGRAVVEGKASLWQQTRAVGAYVRRNVGRFALHGAVLIALLGFLLWSRWRVRAATAHDPSLTAASVVFEAPVLTSIVLSFLVSIWIYPQAPRLLWAIIGASGLVPTILILRRLVDKRLLVVLDAMVVFYFVDQVRGVVATEHLISRGVFILEMGGGVLFLGSFLGVMGWRARRGKAVLNVGGENASKLAATAGEGRLNAGGGVSGEQARRLNVGGEGTSNIQGATSNVEGGNQTPNTQHSTLNAQLGVAGLSEGTGSDVRNHPHPNPLPAYGERGQDARAADARGDLLYRVTRGFARVLLVVFFLAGVANVVGCVSLSNLIGDGALGSAYLAVILYAAVRLVDGMILVGLRVRPLAYLSIIRRNEPAIRAWAGRLLRWVAFAFWVYVTLEMLWLWDRAAGIGRAILSKQLTLGSIHFSLGPLVAFGLTIWAAVLVSRLVRFILEQDVYGRLPMSGGLSYAVSRMVHYAILLVGIFVGAGVAGYPLTQLTFLGGALAVGLGFGTQNIVNNFVSGLILLFEQPIKVGDLVEISGSSGIVTHIGIRASVIRTADSSEIIVPNGNLISNAVTNWTLSNRQRGIEIPVAVAAGTDPHRVIGLLEKVAKENPRIVDSPAPEALLTGFDGGSFKFTLRAFTNQPEKYAEVSSELAVAVHDALGREGIEIK